MTSREGAPHRRRRPVSTISSREKTALPLWVPIRTVCNCSTRRRTAVPSGAIPCSSRSSDTSSASGSRPLRRRSPPARECKSGRTALRPSHRARRGDGPPSWTVVMVSAGVIMTTAGAGGPRSRMRRGGRSIAAGMRGARSSLRPHPKPPHRSSRPHQQGRDQDG